MGGGRGRGGQCVWGSGPARCGPRGGRHEEKESGAQPILDPDPRLFVVNGQCLL